MQTPGRGWWCEEHQRHECVSPRKNGRGTCHGSLVADSDRCRMHLGKKAQPAIAEARLQEQAAAELARLDVPPVSDPLAELARLAGQCISWKDAIGERVNQLASIRYQDAKGSEQLRGEIQLFERALDRCASTLVAIARLDIDGRLTGVREATADMLVSALETALSASGLDYETQWQVRDVFRRSIVLIRPLAESPEVTQAELVEGEIRAMEARHPALIPVEHR
jgi:hypothetical protein